MTPRGYPTRPRDGHLRASVVSDGTMAGTKVFLNGTELRNVAAVDLRIAPDGAQLLISVGHAVIDYGAPSSVEVTGARATLTPAPTPRDPR